MNQVTAKSEFRLFRIMSGEHWVLLIIISLSIAFYLWGIQRDLPYIYEVDEPAFVLPAIRMAATGDLNPQWFGHPGSTVIYSLAALYHFWGIVTYDGGFLQANPTVQTQFDKDFTEFYLLGRILSIAFGVLGIFMTYKLGQRAFGKKVGLVGAWLALLAPFIVVLTRNVRTDSASLFFSALSLWLCLELYERPTIKNQILTGIGIGLSIATKYYLAALIPVFIAVNALLLRSQDKEAGRSGLRWLGVFLGLFAIGASFALITPYFFLDFATVRESLAVMSHNTHLGQDGLSFWGNLRWYLGTAIPQSMHWSQVILTIVGFGLVLVRRRIKPLLLVGYATLFLVVLSVHSLHWARWLFPIWPVLALLTAFALESVLKILYDIGGLSNKVKRSLGLTAVILISAQPMYKVILLGIRHANPSTRILAREWMVTNLPANSAIAQENYTAPLSDTTFAVSQYSSLATIDRSLDDYYDKGFRYLVVSSYMYNRYLAEPERYPNEIVFYQTLFDEVHLLQAFEPSPIRDGPTIRVYAFEKS